MGEWDDFDWDFDFEEGDWDDIDFDFDYDYDYEDEFFMEFYPMAEGDNIADYYSTYP